MPRSFSRSEHASSHKLWRGLAIALWIAIAIALIGPIWGAGPDRLPQGRYLLPLAPVFIALGSAMAQRLWRYGPILLALIILALDLWMVFGTLWPAMLAPL